MHANQLAAARDQDVLIYDVATGKELAVLGHEWVLTSMRLSADAELIATVTYGAHADPTDADATMLVGSIVRVWDIASATELTQIPMAGEGVIDETVLFGPRGELAADLHLGREHPVALFTLAGGLD